MRALLIGNPPGYPLGYEYVTGKPYEAVVIGSLTLSQQLCFSEQAVLEALAADQATARRMLDTAQASLA